MEPCSLDCPNCGKSTSKKEIDETIVIRCNHCKFGQYMNIPLKEIKQLQNNIANSKP